MTGAVQVADTLDSVKQALLAEGFVDPSPFQQWKAGQVFGLVKRISNVLEMHVRGYRDNTLDSEIELSREFIEHQSCNSKPYYGALIEILRNHGIPLKMVKHVHSDPGSIEIPRKLTRWKPLLAFSIIMAILAGVTTIFLTSDKE